MRKSQGLLQGGGGGGEGDLHVTYVMNAENEVTPKRLVWQLSGEPSLVGVF